MKIVEKNVSSDQVLGQFVMDYPEMFDFQALLSGTATGTLYFEFSNDPDVLGWNRDTSLDTDFSIPGDEKITIQGIFCPSKNGRVAVENMTGSIDLLLAEVFTKGDEK